MAPIEVRDRSLVIEWGKSLPSSGAEKIRALRYWGSKSLANRLPSCAMTVLRSH
jgi:hypothetical protein